jgi:hypothetical protein
MLFGNTQIDANIVMIISLEKFLIRCAQRRIYPQKHAFNVSQS